MEQSRLIEVLTRRLAAGVPDAELLGRYRSGSDAAAFAQLVARYSRLVWQSCRQLLPDDADADDAFQATFLVLARSAGTLRPGAPLGPWLHGVAFRVCQNARRARRRRAKHERAAAAPEAGRPVADSAWEEAFAVATEEVVRLPAAERAAFVLCHLEGRTAADAAAALGVTPGTLATRLHRAKQKLLGRLAQRGLGPALLALGGAAGTGAVRAALVRRTLALIQPGATVPAAVQVLTPGVISMALLTPKMFAIGVLVVGLATAGLGVGAGSGRIEVATAQPPVDVVAPPKAEAMGRTDPLVFDKLKKIHMMPSDLDSDEMFLRRVYLDLVGLSPSKEEIEKFLADKSASKRERLIDALLERPQPEGVGRGGLIGQPAQLEHAELAKLQGRWQLVKEEFGKGVRGSALAPEAREVVKVIEGNRVTTFVMGEKRGVQRIAVDPSQTPPTLVRMATDTQKDYFAWCLYEVTADTLRVCEDIKGNGRPSSFRVTEHTAIFEYRRIKMTEGPTGKSSKTFDFHPEPVPATGLKVELAAGTTVVRDKRGLVLPVRVANASGQPIGTSLAHEWHGGEWPPTSLFASVTPEAEREPRPFAPVYLAGEDPGRPRAVSLAAGKGLDVEVRADWPGTGSVKRDPLIDKPGRYVVRLNLVFEAGGKTQYAASEPVVVEYKAK